MLSFVSSVIVGLFIALITSLIGCGEGGDGSVNNEVVSNNGVGNNNVSSNDVNNGVSSNDINNGVSSNDINNGVSSNGDGNNGVGPGPKASLAWHPVKHYRPVTYTVYFGKRSSGQAGSCNYENSVDVSIPHAMITGLESNTLYFFAVSASDGYLRSQCSNEVSKKT